MDERVVAFFEVYLSVLVCSTRYQHDPQLAGLKEPVLAASLDLPQARVLAAQGRHLLDAGHWADAARAARVTKPPYPRRVRAVPVDPVP